jgi:hypothetical protein
MMAFTCMMYVMWQDLDAIVMRFRCRHVQPSADLMAVSQTLCLGAEAWDLACFPRSSYCKCDVYFSRFAVEVRTCGFAGLTWTR